MTNASTGSAERAVKWPRPGNPLLAGPRTCRYISIRWQMSLSLYADPDCESTIAWPKFSRMDGLCEYKQKHEHKHKGTALVPMAGNSSAV